MLGASEGWITMNDNGINGDRVPNDGIFTVELSLRVLFQLVLTRFWCKQPIISSQHLQRQYSLQLKSSEVLPGVSSETLSSSVLIVILVLFSIVAIIAIISLSRRGKQGDNNNDRFGLSSNKLFR